MSESNWDCEQGHLKDGSCHNSKEIERNIRLQRYLPLGYVSMTFEALERLWEVETPHGKTLLLEVMKKLEEYDKFLRDNNYRDD